MPSVWTCVGCPLYVHVCGALCVYMCGVPYVCTCVECPIYVSVGCPVPVGPVPCVQREFEERRNAEYVEVQRLEEQERRRTEEKVP